MRPACVCLVRGEGLVMGASRNCTAVRFPLLRDGVMALAGMRGTREAGLIGGSCYSPVSDHRDLHDSVS